MLFWEQQLIHQIRDDPIHRHCQSPNHLSAFKLKTPISVSPFLSIHFLCLFSVHRFIQYTIIQLGRRSHTAHRISSEEMPDELTVGCCHTVRSHGTKLARTHLHDWLILILLGLIELGLNLIEPFHRYVGEGMMTDLKFPLKPNTIPIWTVPIIAVLIPVAFFLVYYIYRRDVYDLHHAILGILYSMLVTGVLTDSIKDAVGRPRPNFFWRCFPNGKAVFDAVTGDVRCTGDKRVIKEGYKSFPSGHTSWSFAGLCFLSWYLAGKVRLFDRRGHIAKLCLVFLPLLVACLVGISRVDDYWHHWTDVFTGALIGSVVASFCYLQFFPFPHHKNGWGPHAYFTMLLETQATPTTRMNAPTNHTTDDMTEARMSNV